MSPGSNVAAAELVRRRAVAHEVLDRRDPADDLVDRGRDQRRVVAQPLQLVGVLDQRVQPAGHRRRRRVVAGRGDDHVVRDRLHHAERLAVDRGVGDRRRQVVGRVGPALLGELREVDEEVVDDGDEVLQLRARGRAPRRRRRTAPGSAAASAGSRSRAGRGWPGSPAAGTAWRCRGRSRTRRRARPSCRRTAWPARPAGLPAWPCSSGRNHSAVMPR